MELLSIQINRTKRTHAWVMSCRPDHQRENNSKLCDLYIYIKEGGAQGEWRGNKNIQQGASKERWLSPIGRLWEAHLLPSLHASAFPPLLDLTSLLFPFIIIFKFSKRFFNFLCFFSNLCFFYFYLFLYTFS